MAEPTEVVVPVGALKAVAWFFENSLDVFLAIEKDILRRTNGTWTSLTGWTAEEAQGLSFWSLVHPDDVAAARAAMDGLVEIGDRAEHDHRLAKKDGGWLWVRHHAVRGGDGWLLAILRDITAERERERRRDESRRTGALLRDSAGVTTWRYNPDTDEYDSDPDMSDAAVDSTMPRSSSGRSVRPAIHREDAPVLHIAWTRSLTTGEANVMSFRERTITGGWRHVRSAWQGVRRLASGRWEVLGISQDVTALVEARDAAVRGEQAALAAVEAKALFLANISHEIRTPMNGVLGILHLLQAEPPRERREQLVREALASGVGLSDLLNDIIDYSDVEAGRLDLNPMPIDPAAELESVLALLRPQALVKGLALNSQADSEIGWVTGDPARLRKMAFHLIANAVKFTSTGRIDVVLSASGEGPARRLHLEVTDTGVGIPAAVQASLFERFRQGDGSSTRRFGGLGLGLAVTQRLAELMSGQVGYVSTEGQGSRFWFDIAAPSDQAPPAAAEPEGGWLSGLHILVVEDNPTNRLVATTMLRQLGAEVETADDGAQGLAAVEQADFDLIFMDIQMPVMDGVEATRRIRALPSPKGETPIVATTANVMPEQLTTYAQSGINGVVAKPISPQALLAEVARVAEAA
jgi:PAS domain S-box-containing protein